ILVDLQVRPHAGVNTLILAIGAALANLIGTTGASMLLIRPLLRVNARRANNRHLPVFFIFIVANLGGLLTPLGDPPLSLRLLHASRAAASRRLTCLCAGGVLRSGRMATIARTGGYSRRMDRRRGESAIARPHQHCFLGRHPHRGAVTVAAGRRASTVAQSIL